MGSFFDCFCKDCPIFEYFWPKSAELVEKEEPLLEKKDEYKEPLIAARIARENSSGDWDQLQSLQTPSNWNNISSRSISYLNPTVKSILKAPKIERNIRNRRVKRSSLVVDKDSSTDDGEESDNESNCEDDFEIGEAKPVLHVRPITRKKNSLTLQSASDSSSKTPHKKVVLKANSTASISLCDSVSEATSPLPKPKYKYRDKSFSSLFVLGQFLGNGSTAKVYTCKRKRPGNVSPFSRAKSKKDTFNLAVKVLDKKKLVQFSKKKKAQSNLLQQFRQEIEILDHLRHPNIIRIFGMFESTSTLHVVTELCLGGELFTFLTSQPDGSLNGKKEVISRIIVRQISSALTYIHEQGIIHRDIKLENILLLKELTISSCLNHLKDINCKLIDFGLAKSHMRNKGYGRAKTFFGTVGYLAPEMFKNKSYDNGVDIWALGVLSYVLLCGTFPFENQQNHNHNIRTDRKRYRIKFPSHCKNKISNDAKKFVKSLLEVNPTDRISSADISHMSWLLITKGED